jgi:hypothetical protein
LSVGLVAVVGFVAGSSLELEWNAPPACPTAEVVRARIGPLSGSARATVTEQASGWGLEVRVNGSVRGLTARSCEDAADAAVLIIQLALSVTPAPSFELAVEPAVSTPTEEPVSVATPRWTVHLALHVGTLIGWLEKLTGHLGVTLAAERAALVLLLQAQTSLPQRYEAGGSSLAAVVVHLLVDVRAGACWAFTVGPVRAGPCAVAGLGALSVQGVNVMVPKATTVAVLYGGPGARVSIPLGDWFELSAGVLARASARPSISFQGSQPVVEARWAAFEGFLGAGGFW